MSAELCTDQGDRIKTALDSLKDFGPESIIYFRRDGVEMVGQDNAKVVDIRFVIPASKIRETGGYYKYDCPDDQIEIGIRTKVVSIAMKRFSTGDRVIIGARKGAQREFYVSCKNKYKKFTSDIVAPIVDCFSAATPSVAGMFKYNGSIVMASSMFHGIIGDLLTSEPPVIMFECDGSMLKLSAEGIFSKSSIEIGSTPIVNAEPEGEEETEDKKDVVFQKQQHGSWNVRESYATSHMHRISKAKNMATKITVSIAQNVPASFEYDTQIGTLTYIVCARTADDIDDPKFKGPAVGSEGGADEPARKKKRFGIVEPKSEFDSDGESMPSPLIG